MSSVPANNLNRAKVRQLLAAVGSTKADDTQIEVTPYDWRQPAYFSSSQLAKLANFTKKVATSISEKFAQLYHNDFNVTITSTTQHWAFELFDQILSSGQNDYYLAFGPPGRDQQHLCGFISIPAQTAVTWAKQLLGDAEPDSVPAAGAGQARILSQLEESLLFDIACSIVESLSICLRGYYDLGPRQAATIHPISQLVKGQLPIELQAIEKTCGEPVESICKLVFGIEKPAPAGGKPAAASEVYLLVPCCKLTPVVGKSVETDKSLEASDISKAILAHLQQMPVSITAQLAVAVVSFEQLMSLRPCDILLLDKAVDEPIELIVEGRTLFRGQPAKSAGQYAVVVTELSANAEQNINPITGT